MMKKYLSALLTVMLLAGLCSVATMEDGDVVSAAVEPEIAEADSVGLEGLYASDEIVELSAELWEDAPDYLLDMPAESTFAVSAGTSDTTLVRVTQPAAGESVHTGVVKLWCTFINPTPSSFDVADAWKYMPLCVQVLRDDEVVDTKVISGYNQLVFTDEGKQYAEVYLMEAGTYTIRVSVPGSAGVWDSVTVTAQGASVTPVPASTRKPVTENSLVSITSPGHGETVYPKESDGYYKFGVYVKLYPLVSGSTALTGLELYSPLRIDVLNSMGRVAWGTEVKLDAADVAEGLKEAGLLHIADPFVSVGGNYTIRVSVPGSDQADEVKVYVLGPTYPDSKTSPAYSVTPKQELVTIDLAKSNTARLEYALKTYYDPTDNYTYYADAVESDGEIIRYKAISDNAFTKVGDHWECDGWIDYTGVQVGTATLHMYLLVNGTRYDRHAVVVNVIDTSKITIETPAPTEAPTQAPTQKPAATTGKNVVHEGFEVTSPVAGRTYPADEALDVEIDTLKFIPAYANGFIDSKVNDVIVEIDMAGVNQFRTVCEYTSAEIYAIENLLGVQKEGSTKTVAFTPAQTGTYTVKVGFENTRVGCFNNKVTDDNLVGSYTFEVVKAAPTAAPTEAPKADIAKAKVSVKNQVYTGKAIKPAPTVKLGGKTLKKGTDYAVSYKNNKAVGTATVTVKGKGAYTGTVKKTFVINPKAVTGLKLTAGANKLTVIWKKVGGAGGYEIQYGTKSSFSGAKKLTVKKGTATKAALKSLKAGKKYHVRIRAYRKVNKKTYYSAWVKASQKTK